MISALITSDPSADDELNLGGLFVVWFDANRGVLPRDWWWEIPGRQPLASALDLAADLRRRSWPCVVMQEGRSPRVDGRLDIPVQMP